MKLEAWNPKLRAGTLRREASSHRRMFVVANALFLLVLAATMIVPLLNVVSLSLSSSRASLVPGIHLVPSELSLEGFRTVWTQLELWRPFANNVVVTVWGTSLHVLLAAMAGYVLIQPRLPGKRAIVSFILFTMLIPGEAIMLPLYVVNKDLGLLNSLTALVVSGLVSGFSILLMRNFFLSVPYDLAESARLDGAGDFRIFGRIYLPLSSAGLATVTLFEFVGRWNHFLPALLYINDASKYTLQIALSSLIIDGDATSRATFISPNVRMAGIVIALVPLIAIYPLAQKYFVEGIMLGSVRE